MSTVLLLSIHHVQHTNYVFFIYAVDCIIILLIIVIKVCHTVVSGYFHYVIKTENEVQFVQIVTTLKYFLTLIEISIKSFIKYFFHFRIFPTFFFNSGKQNNIKINKSP